jgi:hypothetical protein
MVADVHPVWLAQSKLRRRRYDECIQLCTAALHTNPLDQASASLLYITSPAAVSVELVGQHAAWA